MSKDDAPATVATPTDWLPLAEGLAIFRRPKLSKNWSVHLDIPELGIHRFRRSLKTSDIDLATERAYEHKILAKNSDIDLEQRYKKTPSVKDISDITIEKLERNIDNNTTNSRYILAIRRFSDYFNSSSISQITDQAMEDYFEYQDFKSKTPWRYASTGINKVFKEATKLGAIKRNMAPEIPDFEGVERSRDYFTSEELDVIFPAINKWQSETNNKVALENRKIFNIFCRFIYHTGMRPGTEAQGLKWKDLHLGSSSEYKDSSPLRADNRVWCIRLRKGKTKTTTGIQDLPLSKSALDQLALLALSNKRISPFGVTTFEEALKNTDKEQHIFSRRCGKIPDFSGIWRNQFYETVEDELRPDIKVSLYSFRHCYITEQLLLGKNVTHVAARTRTSIGVIQHYYNKLTAVMSQHNFIND